MIKKAVFYLAGIFLFGFIVAQITKFVLGFLPFVTLGILLCVPFYGMLRKKMNWKDQKFSVKIYAKALGSYFKFNRRSWTFYLVLGIAIGFIFVDIASKIVLTLCWGVVGLITFWCVWEGTRITLDKVYKIQVIPFKDALKAGWN